MHIARFAVPLTMLAAPSAIGQPAPTVAVQLSNFKYTPGRIVLDHGRPYVLRLVNVARGGHNFAAPGFFSAASIAPGDRRLIAEGEVEVPPGQVREIRLTTPAAGIYKLKCTHSFHKMMGMSGTIIVR